MKKLRIGSEKAKNKHGNILYGTQYAFVFYLHFATKTRTFVSLFWIVSVLDCLCFELESTVFIVAFTKRSIAFVIVTVKPLNIF